MVSKKVVIKTKSFRSKEKPCIWECDGSPNFSLKEGKKKDRGKEIILHIDDDSKDYLEDLKISNLLISVKDKHRNGKNSPKLKLGLCLMFFF